MPRRRPRTAAEAELETALTERRRATYRSWSAGGDVTDGGARLPTRSTATSGLWGGGRSHPVGLVRTPPLAVAAGERGRPFNVPRALLLPAGWRAEVWARVDTPRFAVWAPDDRLLVSVPSAGEVIMLEPRADPASPPRRRVLLSGLVEPEGLAFDVLHGRLVLYVAEPGQLDRYTWPGRRRTVVARGLPDADGLDRLKGLAVGASHTVYIGVGSDSLAGGPAASSWLSGRTEAGTSSLVASTTRKGSRVDPAAGRIWMTVNSAGAIPDEIALKLSAGRARVERLLPAHTAPLGFGFLPGSALPAPWRDGAVLAQPTAPRRPKHPRYGLRFSLAPLERTHARSSDHAGERVPTRRAQMGQAHGRGRRPGRLPLRRRRHRERDLPGSRRPDGGCGRRATRVGERWRRTLRHRRAAPIAARPISPSPRPSAGRASAPELERGATA